MVERASEAGAAPEAPTTSVDLEPESGGTRKGVGAATPPPVDPGPRGAPLAPPAGRYTVGAQLGIGGMGEVRLCRDQHIGREMAMKAILPIRSADPDSRARFVREARIQGQLEHPAVVPVYDLGVSPEGAVYFTMKALRGKTLAEVLRALRARDPEALAVYTRRKLLGAFGAVCLAVEFAHARGVVHRDLKPSNVMLGDFGEVYVLDWGIAKVQTQPDAPAGVVLDHGADELEPTTAGRVMGSLGYLSPEQAAGASHQTDARSDVYALGAILFELLTFQPLHPRRTAEQLLRSTLDGISARPSERYPELEVPPELEDVCVRATATDPARRYPTARAVHDAVDAYLEGDRNVALRRELAARHAARAADALEAALREDGSDAPRRREALREAGSALGLDPTNAAALRVVSRALTEPPAATPPAVTAEVNATGEADMLRRLRNAAVVQLAGTLGLCVLALALGVQAWTPFVAAAAYSFVANGAQIVIARGPLTNARWYLAFALSCGVALATGEVTFPIVVTPIVQLANLMGNMADPSAQRRRVTLTMSLGVVVLLFGGELLGALPPTFRTEQGRLVLVTRVVPARFEPVVLMAGALGLAVTAGAAGVGSRGRGRLHALEVRAATQRWQLRQLLPDALPEHPTR